MIDLVRPELLALLSLVLVIFGILGSVLYLKVLRPRYLASDFYRRYGLVVGTLGEIVSDTVLRLAFSREDLAKYQAEADAKGRDVRLQAAIHLIDQYTNSQGIALDEEQIVSKIEATLAQLKYAGLVPSDNPFFQPRE